MPELASLDLVIRNGQVVAATQSLQGLVGASVNAEAATTGFASATRGGERAVSQMAFGLTRMAASGDIAGLGLRSVEMGLMRLAPSLGGVLVGVVVLYEAYHLLTKAMADAEKKAEEQAKAYDDFLKSLGGAGATEQIKQAEAVREHAAAIQRVADATAAVAVAQAALTAAQRGPADRFGEVNTVTQTAALKTATTALTQAQTEQNATGVLVAHTADAVTVAYHAQKAALDELLVKATEGEVAAYRLNLAHKGYSEARINALVAEKTLLDGILEVQKLVAGIKPPPGLEVTDARAAAEQANTLKAAMKIAALEAGDEAKKLADTVDSITRTMLRDMQHAFAQFFLDVNKGGLQSFQDLFDAVGKLWQKLVADMAAANLTAAFKPVITGTGGVDLGKLGAAAKDIGIGVGLSLLTSALDDLFNGAARAAEAMRQFNATMETFRQAMMGTTLDQQITGIRAQADELKAHLLFQVDRDRIDQWAAEGIAKLIAAFNERVTRATEDLQVRMLRATGHGGAADDLAFQLQQQREVSDAATAAGLSLQDFAKTTLGVALAATLAAEAQQRAADATEAAAAVTQAGVDRLLATAATLQAFSDALKLDKSRTTLDPMQQYAEARKQYESVLTQAQGGDQAAAGKLPAVAQAFLDASRAVNASGMGYAQDFAAVQKAVDAITAMFQSAAHPLADLSTSPNIIRIADQTAATADNTAATVAALQDGLSQTINRLDTLAALMASGNALISRKLEGALLLN